MYKMLCLRSVPLSDQQIATPVDRAGERWQPSKKDYFMVVRKLPGPAIFKWRSTTASTRRLSARLFVALSLAILLLLASCSSNTPPPPPPPPAIEGLADFHSHEFASLGFAGRLHTHDVDPNAPCKPPLTYDSDFRLVNLVRNGLAEEATAQGPGVCYPTYSNLAGQQMDTDSLKRAWEYGLRLNVVFAVNSEILCLYAQLQRPHACETDQVAIDRQLQAAKDLQDQIDVESGGPGKGWYRIVHSPEEARRVIGQGKLAVVLGVEASNAFGCSYKVLATVKGVPNLFGDRPNEPSFGLVCDDTIASGATRQRALALFEHYWDLGARDFFTVHTLDGVAGGTALSTPLLHAVNNPSRLKAGGLFNRVDDINALINAVRPPITSFSCGSLAFDGGRCNSDGLTSDGVALLRLMADYGAIIDLDHLSAKAKRAAMSDTEQGLGPYPFISSHSGFAAINHGDKLSEVQVLTDQADRMIRFNGAFAPILRPATEISEEDTFPPGATVAPHTCGGTTETFIQAYRYIVDKLQKGTLWSGGKPFVGVGYGSDFDGLAGWPAPRFDNGGATGGISFGETLREAFVGGSTLRAPGRCFGFTNNSSQPHVNYPFKSPMTGSEFDKSVLPWSGRTQPYDISYDGVAHVGMIPDFVEEMRVLGLTDSELSPLWHGAEAYIREWEASQSWAGSFSPENDSNLREQCRQTRTKLVEPVFSTPQPNDPGPQIDIASTKVKWDSAIADLQRLGCHGTTPIGAPPEPSSSPGASATPRPSATSSAEPPDSGDEPPVCSKKPYLPQCGPTR